jgi:hypothetical protein
MSRQRKIGIVASAAVFGVSLPIALAGCGGGVPSVSHIITTVAGKGTYGVSTGDGGPATDAQMWDPTCVAKDAAGDLFIGDLANYNVRKVDSVTGIISTYAGTGTAGFSGDGGPAKNAAMHGPTACAVDAAGNLYPADDANNVIRKIAAATGIITTVAGNGAGAGTPSGGSAGDGGPATAAEINHPFGVLVDAAGNLYIADTLNYRVRMVAAGTGIMTTIAGTGTYGYKGDGGLATNALMSNPEGLALDAAGNLYVAEQGNGVIRKITMSTGIISTVAGNGKVDGTGRIEDDGDGGPATAATLGAAQGVAVDASGNIYIADTSHSIIRKVTAATGMITRVVGSSQAGYRGDGGLATDAQLHNPENIILDAAGNLYIADYVNGAVRKVTPAP